MVRDVVRAAVTFVLIQLRHLMNVSWRPPSSTRAVGACPHSTSSSPGSRRFWGPSTSGGPSGRLTSLPRKPTSHGPCWSASPEPWLSCGCPEWPGGTWVLLAASCRHSTSWGSAQTGSPREDSRGRALRNRTRSPLEALRDLERGLEIRGVEPLGEASVDRGQEVTRRHGLSLLMPQPGEVGGAAQLQGQGALAARPREGVLKVGRGRTKLFPRSSSSTLTSVTAGRDQFAPPGLRM